MQRHFGVDRGWPRDIPAGLPGLLWVEEIWWPYEEGGLPCPVPFEEREGQAYLNTAVVPEEGDVVCVLYAAAQTIAGLDGTQETTVPGELSRLLVLGATGFAALAKAVAMAREYAWPTGATAAMAQWAHRVLRRFEQGLQAMRRPQAPGWVSWG